MIDKLRGALKSWVIRFNALAGVMLAILPMLQDALPMLAQYVPDLKYVAVVVIVGNVLLRFKTTTSLAEK